MTTTTTSSRYTLNMARYEGKHGRTIFFVVDTSQFVAAARSAIVAIDSLAEVQRSLTVRILAQQEAKRTRVMAPGMVAWPTRRRRKRR